MEHGKFSISKIWHIAKMEYIKLIMDPRMILIVAALVFAYQFITVPLLQNAAMMGKPINVYEPFVALLNSNFMILLVPAVFLAIMSDYPRIDGNTLFVVQRAGKGNWFFGQILYAQMSILSYLLVVFVGMMVPVLWGGSFSAKWSPDCNISVSDDRDPVSHKTLPVHWSQSDSSDLFHMVPRHFRSVPL